MGLDLVLDEGAEFVDPVGAATGALLGGEGVGGVGGVGGEGGEVEGA